MAKEIEMKYRLSHPRALRQALRRAGAIFLGSAVVRDEYFDTRGMDLLGADSGLRLRCQRTVRHGEGGRHGGEGAILTYKGPADRTSRAKVRREVETAVENPRALAELLGALGFASTVLIEKRRSSYRLGRCTVEVDELPLLGAFVEIEGPSVRALTEAGETLGLTGPGIRDHYVNLLRARCKRIARSCRLVTPKACRNCEGPGGRKSETRGTKSK
ncbi:MAG: class IV adenylate cyclase [Planctomycetota bacterium]